MTFGTVLDEKPSSEILFARWLRFRLTGDKIRWTCNQRGRAPSLVNNPSESGPFQMDFESTRPRILVARDSIQSRQTKPRCLRFYLNAGLFRWILNQRGRASSLLAISSEGRRLQLEFQPARAIPADKGPCLLASSLASRPAPRNSQSQQIPCPATLTSRMRYYDAMY